VEVCFVDVAQGASSVLLLGNREAIVIDAGGRHQSRVVLDFLKTARVDTISRLIVTHNHADHSAGAAAILTEYQGSVGEVWMLYDSVLGGSMFWNRVAEEIATGRLSRTHVRRLERGPDPNVVYDKNGAILAILAPDLIGNVVANQQAKPNDTSGILLLMQAGQQVVFAGDATLTDWRNLWTITQAALPCLLMTVPHHGGKTWEKEPKESDQTFAARIQVELDWLFTHAVRPRVGVISVGTSNTFKHPRPEVIAALRRNGVTPVCSQMTKQCEPSLEAQRARALPIIEPSRSSPTLETTRKGASSNVACAGTLVAELLPGRCVIRRLGELQGVIGQIAPVTATTGPLCRR
jgi:competence protein ComEC